MMLPLTHDVIGDSMERAFFQSERAVLRMLSGAGTSFFERRAEEVSPFLQVHRCGLGCCGRRFLGTLPGKSSSESGRRGWHAAMP